MTWEIKLSKQKGEGTVITCSAQSAKELNKAEDIGRKINSMLDDLGVR
jgi:hypothetical protein